MKHYFIAAFLLPGTLVLLQGCKHKAQNDAPNDTPGETKTESRTQMVLIPGGRFTMGVENEIDAKPHQVVVSSFYIDK